MTEQAKTESWCPESGRGATWYPLRKWWQPSWLLNQDSGLPPFLEPGDPRWVDVDWLQRKLAACSWPGYIPAPLFVPYISGIMHHPSPKISKEQYKWRVSLDVAHFSPSEISLSAKDGFLEVGGKHEERPDEHGFIGRCFTRKYRLPVGIDVTKFTSTLSVDGVLSVEAPLPDSSIPADIIIPIKVEKESTGEQGEEYKKEDTPETDAESRDHQPSAPGAAEVPEFPSAEAPDRGEASPQEVHSDQAQPGSTTAGPQQREEGREQEEETHGEPAGGSHPSAPADGEGTESLQESFKHHEALDIPDSPDTAASKQTETVEGEIQVMEGSGEAAEELTQPEEPELGKSPPSEGPSQELEQDHTK
ncbi:uncharacterized protein LOC139910369 [Centroberyx gerrardi]